MCLAIPARIVELTGVEAVVDLHGNRVPVSTILVPEAVLGDWVLVHAGFAIQRLDAQTAEETWAVLEDVQRAEAAANAELMEAGDDQPSRNPKP